jgi:hypothetical protein
MAIAMLIKVVIICVRAEGTAFNEMKDELKTDNIIVGKSNHLLKEVYS